MATHYVLIDYENVQPKDLSLAQGCPCRTLVFVGKNQKLAVECANALQPLGKRAEYVQINGSGRNALDFHIAFYLGELAARDPGAVFCVISKDKGFDLLIDHLNARGIRARRCVDIASAVASGSVDAERDGLLAEIVKDLRKRGDKRPATERTLIRALVARFPAKLGPDTALGVVEALQKNALIAIEDGRVAYKL